MKETPINENMNSQLKILTLTIRGEQSDTGADPTDRRRPSRTAFVTDRLSRGRRSDGEFHSDAGAVLPSELQLQTELVTEPTDMAIFCIVLRI